MAGKSKYDWEAIWVDYRAGVLSVREVAKKHGVDCGYLHRKAKKSKIKRDLTARVKQAALTKLVNETVNTSNNSDDEIVEAESDKVVEIVKLHRKDIASGQKAVRKLLEKLSDIDEIEDAKTLQTYSSVAVNLANATKSLIGLSRQAFSLDDSAGSEKGGDLAYVLEHLHDNE